MSKNGAEQKGNRQITHETREMTDCAKKLSDKADIKPEIDNQLLVVTEELLDQSKNLRQYEIEPAFLH